MDYPHIEPRPLYHDAAARVELFPVKVAPNLRVGYVMGAGDDGPAALAQLGVALHEIFCGRRGSVNEETHFESQTYTASSAK